MRNDPVREACPRMRKGAPLAVQTEIVLQHMRMDGAKSSPKLSWCTPRAKKFDTGPK